MFYLFEKKCSVCLFVDWWGCLFVCFVVYICLLKELTKQIPLGVWRAFQDRYRDWAKNSVYLSQLTKDTNFVVLFFDTNVIVFILFWFIYSHFDRFFWIYQKVQQQPNNRPPYFQKKYHLPFLVNNWIKNEPYTKFVSKHKQTVSKFVSLDNFWFCYKPWHTKHLSNIWCQKWILRLKSLPKCLIYNDLHCTKEFDCDMMVYAINPNDITGTTWDIQRSDRAGITA